MIATLQILLRNLMLIALSLALLTLPFAHRAGAEPVSGEMAEYLALGGSVSELCGDSVLHPSGGCESCRIVETASLAPRLHIWTATLEASSQAILPAAKQTITTNSYSNRPPARAPPAV